MSQIIDIQTRIDASLIGKNAKVLEDNKKPNTINLMLGDLSYIKL